MANHVMSEAQKCLAEDKFDEAAAIYGNIIDLEPALVPALVQRGRSYWEMHKWDKALKDFEKAVRYAPDDANAAWTLGLLYLQMNRFTEGWPLYEGRWGSETFKSPRLRTSKPQYKLSNTGRVLVWPEQGLGDQIIYSSLLDTLSKKAEVTAMVDIRLVAPLSRGNPHIKFIPHDAKVSMNDHDYNLPIASLGSLFIQNQYDITKYVSHKYMKADSKRTKKLAETLGIGEDEKVIGLSWSSHAPTVGKHKSCPLEALEPILSWGKARGYKFICLDYAGTQPHADIIDPFCINMFLDVDGVCSLIDRCEFIVSVSNVNVHYAGAMCVPVYLLDANKLWYWNNRVAERNLWYPSVKVYPREHMLASWDKPVQNIIKDLENDYD